LPRSPRQRIKGFALIQTGSPTTNGHESSASPASSIRGREVDRTSACPVPVVGRCVIMLESRHFNQFKSWELRVMSAIPVHTRYNTNQRIPRKSNISANPSWGCRVPVGWSLGTEQAQWGELAASAALFFDLWLEHPLITAYERQKHIRIRDVRLGLNPIELLPEKTDEVRHFGYAKQNQHQSSRMCRLALALSELQTHCRAKVLQGRRGN
jgi:hypothetical protein